MVQYFHDFLFRSHIAHCTMHDIIDTVTCYMIPYVVYLAQIAVVHD